MRAPRRLPSALSSCVVAGCFFSLTTDARGDDAPSAAGADRHPLVYDDGFVLQSEWAQARLYPRAVLDVDGHATFGAGASNLRGADGTEELAPRVLVRRALFELGGGAFGFLDSKVTVDVDGRGTFGDPLLPNAHATRVGVRNAWINGAAGPSLNLMTGIQPTPFSLELRTDPDEIPSLEPSLASQLGVPCPRSMGGSLWGVTTHETVGYDVMGIAGCGTTIPTDVAERGVAGRVFVRPLSLDRRLGRLQIGISGRFTWRDGRASPIDRDDLTTGNGFALFSRRFQDSLGRTEDVLPSGTQRALGVELSSPLVSIGRHHLTFTGELYLVDDDTREAVEGFAVTNTQRLGDLQGNAWYAELSYLVDPLYRSQDLFNKPHDVPYSLARSLDPGLYPHPRRRERVGVPPPIQALTDLQFTFRVSRIDATYNSTRGASVTEFGTPDPKSPGGRLDVWEIGGGASVWWTRIFRFTVAWQSYVAPDAGTPLNRAVVAGQLGGAADARWMHELTVRARLAL